MRDFLFFTMLLPIAVAGVAIPCGIFAAFVSGDWPLGLLGFPLFGAYAVASKRFIDWCA